MEPNEFPRLGRSIVEAEHQAALFGGHMWSGYKDRTSPFQTSTTTGSEPPQKEQGLLKNKYAAESMNISNLNLARLA